jgi:hypothetical protein
MPFIRLCLVFTASLVAAGCLNASTLIRVMPSGSGTVEQTLLFNARNMENAFAGLGLKPSGGSKAPEDKWTTIDKTELEQRAHALGEGVTLVSVTPVKLPSGYEGATVKFAFEDITRLGTEDFLMPGPAKERKEGGAVDAIAFTMARGEGGTSVLTATFNDKPGKSSGKSGKTGKAAKGGPDTNDPEVQQMMKALFKGFRIGMDLEVVGQLVRTDADYVVGKRITLAEIDLEQLLRETKKMEAIDKMLGPDASIAKMRPYLKDMKGLKINRPVVTVEFR